MKRPKSFNQYQMPAFEFSAQRDGGTMIQLSWPCSQCNKPMPIETWSGPVCAECRETGKRKLADVPGTCR